MEKKELIEQGMKYLNCTKKQAEQLYEITPSGLKNMIDLEKRKDIKIMEEIINEKEKNK